MLAVTDCRTGLPIEFAVASRSLMRDLVGERLANETQ